MALAEDSRLKDTRGGGERIDRGVDALLGYLTAENGGSVKVGEGRGRGGVGQIVRRDVDRLNGGDGTGDEPQEAGDCDCSGDRDGYEAGTDTGLVRRQE